MQEENDSHSPTQEISTNTVEPAKQNPGQKKKVLLAALIFAIVASVIFGASQWHTSKTNALRDENTRLTSEIVELQKTQAEQQKEASEKIVQKETNSKSTLSNLIVPGQADLDVNHQRDPSGKSMYIEALVNLNAGLKEIWMDYGTSVNNLNQESQHQTRGLAEGAGFTNFGNFVVVLQKESLKPGVEYFYRISAKKADGTIIHSGTASFASLK